MKKLLIFCGIFGVLFAHAQDYCPVPDTNAFWKEVYVVFGPSNASSYLQDEYVNGDTVIGSYTYTKVYADGRVTDNSGTSYFSNWYRGAIRNDSINRKVYIIRPVLDTVEQLLYDFDLSVGQLTPSTVICQDQFLVTAIDSIYYLNRWHRRIRTSEIGPAGEYNLIEGIGSNYAFTFYYSTTILQQLFCFYQDDRPCWPDTSSGCATEVGFNDTQTEPEIFISPNPVSENLTINIKGSGTFYIYNNAGQLIETHSFINGEATILDVSSFPPGMYLIQVNSEGGLIASRRFIVK